LSNAVRISRPVGFTDNAVVQRPTRERPGQVADPRQVRLRAVTTAQTSASTKSRPKIQFAVVGVLGFALIMGAQLVMSLVLSDGAYQLSRLKTETVQLERTTADLSQKIEVLSSPQNLAVSAEKLGMVTATRPAFLNLTTGKVTAGVKNIGKGTSLLGKTSISNIALQKLGYLTILAPEAADAEIFTTTTTTTTTNTSTNDPNSTGIIAGPKTN